MIPQLVNLLIYLIVVGLLAGLVFYVVDAVPIPAPFNRLIKIAVVVVVILIVILLLLQLTGGIGPLSVPRV
jgi:hypothetical protein